MASETHEKLLDAIHVNVPDQQAETYILDCLDFELKAVRAESPQGGHVANCRCHDRFYRTYHSKEHSGCRYRNVHTDITTATGAAWVCKLREHAHPYTDPRCLPGLLRDERMCAQARAAVPRLMKSEMERTGMSAEDALLIALESTRAEVERLEKEARDGRV